MKLKVVACGVFEPELSELVRSTGNEIQLHILDAGLHATPDLLREQAQRMIDEATGGGFDAVVVVYGLCGRGTSGLLARDTPVIIPRVHDCMTLFLGSREEYRRQFARHPGTFYTTLGWYHKKLVVDQPRQGNPSTLAEIRDDPRYPDLAAKYGEANAADIIRFFDAWKRKYTRAAFIDTGVGDRKRYAAYAEDMARAFGWTYECLHGQTESLASLLAGDWDETRMLVLRPGQRSVLTGDERIFAAIDAGAASVGEGPATAQPDGDCLLGPDTSGNAPAAPAAAPGPDVIGLGIDAGGTYTDCVLYNMTTRTVLAKAKALTTHHELMHGIDEALDCLALAEPERIALAALSTTLATNSIVEGKGGLPGAIIMSAAPTSTAQIEWRPLRTVGGEMGIDGYEISPPDRDEIAQAVDELIAAGVDAFAVSGYAGVKNPAHEMLVRDVIRARCDLPVVCGHELSSRLDYVSRANTAILNARLLPVVRSLLDAAQASLEGRGIHATLMVVKGDGSLINRRTALERPVETVLSGPAASVSGARHLTGLRDAIVLDMGGTTTDTAIIEDGLVRISPQGASVGGWRTSVEAADISTAGLGGDSYLSFTVDRKLQIGPRRVVPLAYLCACHPQAREQLMALDAAAITDRGTPAALDFFVLSRDAYATTLDDRERQIIDALRHGALSRAVLAARVSALSPRLLRTKRLEQLGLVLRSALTPTDLLHVTGEFDAWDIAAARHALQVWAGLFGTTPDEAIERIRDGITRRLAGQIIVREVPDAYGEDPEHWPPLLRGVFGGNGSAKLKATLTYTRPIVAIGAPVKPFFPPVGEALHAEVVIPEHAEVANAIGAVASEVVVREHAVVRPGEIANYVVHTRAGRTEHMDLHGAVESAKRETANLARTRAHQSGTSSSDVKHHVNERRAFSAEGDEVLIEVLIEATVSGLPALV